MSERVEFWKGMAEGLVLVACALAVIAFLMVVAP